jgi:DNA-directed RNA polymerase subunit beta'
MENTNPQTKNSQTQAQEFTMIDFSGLKIRLASPEDILKWSYGEVTKPETINYRTFRAEKDGLFDERIFGPTKDYECYCGKYKRYRYKGIICDRCGVEVTTSAVRRERMGHIKLATPIAHIWYFKGTSSALSILTGIPPQALERIIYYALYLVKKVDGNKQKEAVRVLKEIQKKEEEEIEKKYELKKEEVEKKTAEEKELAFKKISSQEQRMIISEELDFKKRNQLKIISDEYIEEKSQKTAFFERLIKTIRNLKPFDTLEEEDYLYLKEKGLSEMVEVGMGAEVLYEFLNNLNLQKEYEGCLKELAEAKGEKRNKLLKKTKIIESFLKAEIKPLWMVLTVLPVIPPGLRPVVQLPGGKVATSDLNDFYRRVINRNNRLKQLIDLGAPDIILRNEKRMLQEAVDALIDLQKARGRARTTGAASKVQKSLSDILRGKQGRFRQNLLGKRVDYSGRSTIIVGPELRLDQCGLPKEMALELFKPFLLHELIIRGFAANIKNAKNLLEEKNPVVYDILEEITKNHPVLLNRAPTLHKLSILAFYPVLTDNLAISLHPAVCAGYNADFDGDAMALFLPLSKKVIEEIKQQMLPYYNLLKPADGSPIVVPNKEMALGCYYLTTIDKNLSLKDEELLYFSDESEAINNYLMGRISLRQPIWVKINGQLLKTTVGRIYFNQALPEELRFVNEEVKASDLKKIVAQAIKMFEPKKVGNLIDQLKDIGFFGATMAAGLSVSFTDCEILPGKEKSIQLTEEEVKKIEKSYEQGLLTLEEKKRLSNKLWIDVTEKLANETWAKLDEENPVKMIINSGGARATKEQLKQISAMKGLVVDPLGKIIEVPTKSNYRQGLSVFEYVISARGARKGLTDSALKTADAGYLTRRLVDVAHDMIVWEEDCQTKDGLEIKREKTDEGRFKEKVLGRFLAKEVKNKEEKVIAKANQLIDEELFSLFEQEKVEAVVIRSSLTCQAPYGVCQKCYGVDLTNNQVVTIGCPVGIIAAQSIGEPGTQLTMRIRHFGGIVISDVTQGLPRVEELFESRTPKIVTPISEISGKVSIKEDREKEVYYVKITSVGKDGTTKEEEFVIPLGQKLKVKDGELIGVGTPLAEGGLNINDLVAVKGIKEAQLYLLEEIQKVYRSQGISINDKHFEVIIKKMSDKVIIEDEGDTEFVKNEIVSRIRFREENKRVLSQGGQPAVGKVAILGISKAATASDSWLSAASFEQTTNVLSQAALKGQIDYLLGLKENVIIGRLIPVNQELIEKYYQKFLSRYAYHQPTSKEETEKKA